MSQHQQLANSEHIAQDSTGRLPSAKDLMQRIAISQADKMTAAMQRQAAAEAEKKALLDKLSQPSGLSDDEVMKRTRVIVERAANSGQTSVLVYTFPNRLCTDRGRAINQAEPGWEQTLTGVPQEIYTFWQKHLRPLGYRIRYEIVDFPNDMPGDVGITLSWG
jgi:hypothetical protein